MYTIDGCSACKNAKELCDKKGIKYRALPRAGNEELIKKLTNDYKYVPVIIDRNNKFIGGFQELQKLTINLSSGKRAWIHFGWCQNPFERRSKENS